MIIWSIDPQGKSNFCPALYSVILPMGRDAIPFVRLICLAHCCCDRYFRSSYLGTAHSAYSAYREKKKATLLLRPSQGHLPEGSGRCGAWGTGKRDFVQSLLFLLPGAIKCWTEKQLRNFGVIVHSMVMLMPMTSHDAMKIDKYPSHINIHSLHAIVTRPSLPIIDAIVTQPCYVSSLHWKTTKSYQLKSMGYVLSRVA